MAGVLQKNMKVPGLNEEWAIIGGENFILNYNGAANDEERATRSSWALNDARQ